MPLPTQKGVSYPKGQLTILGGRMLTATMSNFEVKGGPKVKHTMNNPKGNGIVDGPVECSGTFEFDVDETGMEIDVIRLCVNGNTLPFGFELPLQNVEIEGKISNVQCATPLDDSVHVTCQWVGLAPNPPVL